MSARSILIRQAICCKNKKPHIIELNLSIPKSWGSFRVLQFSFNQLAISCILLSSQTLAPVGQFFVQAQQRMHSSTSVATLPLIEMAAVGHTLAHVPQTEHVSSLVTGETAMDRAPPSYGNLPGISRSIWASGDCSAATLCYRVHW